MKWIDNISLTLVIVGALNWLLVGIFRFLVFLFGDVQCYNTFGNYVCYTQKQKKNNQ